MWWLITWQEWNEFAWEGDMQGTTVEKEEPCDTWQATIKRFTELIQNNNCAACDVTFMYKDRPFYTDDTYVLSYRP